MTTQAGLVQPWLRELGSWRKRQSQADDAALRLTLGAVVGSRIVVWVAALAAIALVGRNQHSFLGFDPTHLTEPFRAAVSNLAVAPLGRWDSVWFLTVAQHGYVSPQSSAMFPLYPLLIRAGSLVGGQPLLTGGLISLGCFLGSLYMLHRLVALDFGDGVARMTTLLVAFFPTALYLSAVYSESLFLLLSVSAIYAARNDRWAAACLLAALAGATRSNGVLLIVPLALMYLYGPRTAPPSAPDSRRWRPRYKLGASALWLALVPAGIVAYLGYLAISHGAPFAPFHAEADWGRSFSGPFGALWQALTALPSDLRGVVTGSAPALQPGDPLSWPAHNLIDLGFAAFAVAGMALAYRRVPFAYFAYALVLLTHALSYPAATVPLLSLSRFVLVIFPIFIGWGSWLSERRLAARGALGISTALLIAFSGLWGIWGWVA